MLTVKIVNDSTGDREIGNYNCLVKVNSEVIFDGRVENHFRENGIENLLEMLAKEIKNERLDRLFKKMLLEYTQRRN